METTRRNMMATVSVAALVAACGQQTIDVIGTIAAFYQKVQQSVASACAAAGKLVPTIDAIMAITAQVLGGVLVDANLPKAVAEIQKVIDALVAQCPAVPQGGTMAGTARPTMKGADGKEVPVFY
jgi:hypothetical protein